MKIVIISNLYPPYVRGGAEIIVNKLAEGLRDNLHNVVVISTQPYNGWSSLSAQQGYINDLKVYRFFPLNIYFYTNDFAHAIGIRAIWHLLDIFNLHSYFVVRGLLKREKPDLVISHNLMGIGFLIPWLIRQLKVKHVHTLHDVQLYAPSGLIIKGKENNLTQKIVNALGYPALMKKLFGSPALVVSPTSFLAKFYQDKGFFHQSKVLILPNPADRPETALGVNNDGSLRLLYLGQLHSGKGVLQLIEVIKDSALKNVRLRVVGLGPDLRKALDLAHGDERITFYGWRNRSDILDILSQTDVVVLPSICYENSPTVILEALSYGLPVITADIGGAGELIRDGHNGWKFEPGNWKQLGSIISTLAENPSSLHTMADACRATVAHHTVRHYIDNLITALETSKVVDN